MKRLIENPRLKVLLAASVAMSFPICMSYASGTDLDGQVFEQVAAASYMPTYTAKTNAPLPPVLVVENISVSELRGFSPNPQAFRDSFKKQTVASGKKVSHHLDTAEALPTQRVVPAAPKSNKIVRAKRMSHHLDTAETLPIRRFVPAVPKSSKIVSGKRLSHHLDTAEALPTRRFVRAAPKTNKVMNVKKMSHHLDTVDNIPPVHFRPAAPKKLSHSLDTVATVPSGHIRSRHQTVTKPNRVALVKPATSKIVARPTTRLLVDNKKPRPSLHLTGLHHLDETRPSSRSTLSVSKSSLPLVSLPLSPVPRVALSQASGPKVQNLPGAFVNSINQSVSKARSQSTRLAIENLRIKEAEEGLIQAKAQGGFKLSLDSAVGLGQYETDFNVVDRSETDTRLQRAASLDLSLPLYQGGRIKAQKNIAKTGIKSAHANFNVVASDVTQETAIAHLNVIQDRELIKVYTHNVELLENQKKTVQTLVGAGENTVTDEALIDARLASIKVRLEQVRASLAASESNYKKLVGRPAPALMQGGAVRLPTTLQEVKQVAQKNNSQIKVAEADAESAFHNIAVAKSYGRPSLSLQGVVRGAEDQSETIRRNTGAEILLNFKVPLWSGGENSSRVRQAALAQSRAILETRELHNNLNERLEQIWANLESAQRSKAPNLAQKVAAQKAYEAVIKQRNAGLATSLDVLSIEQTLIDAEINLIQAQNIEDVSRFQLLGLMGVL
ncbi:MAG: TolC family protein [Maricaulaceae bacterium]